MFLVMFLFDFYRYVYGYDKDYIVLNVWGKYEKFGFKEFMDYGMIEFYRYFCVDNYGNKVYYVYIFYVFIIYYSICNFLFFFLGVI